MKNDFLPISKYLLVVYTFLFIPALGIAQDKDVETILFFGDSITAGYGVGPDQAFPAIIQQKIDSLDWNFEVVNGGLSGETSAGGLRRIDWILRSRPAVFVLELGGNDGLRGIDLDSTEENLEAIIKKVKNRYPDTRILLAGMQVPPNLGPEYTTRFKNMYPRLAEENNVSYIPFILEGVGGETRYMQGDGIHPNEKGHQIVARNIWERLKPVLREIN